MFFESSKYDSLNILLDLRETHKLPEDNHVHFTINLPENFALSSYPEFEQRELTPEVNAFFFCNSAIFIFFL